MAGPLQGKIAFVTGAGRGIGRAIADRLANDGAAVAVVARTTSEVEKVAAGIVARGGKAIGFQCDVSVEGAGAEAIARTVKELGLVDILINNAHNTSYHSMTADVSDAQRPQLLEQMASGPFGALALMQACFPHMKEHGGRIINFASAAGTRGMAGFLPYAMSKEATRALTRVAAREWGQYGITVNSICPSSPGETPKDEWAKEKLASILKMNHSSPGPIARMGNTDNDIAPLVAFLVGPDAGFLTGYTYWLDGGSSMDTAR